MTRSLNEATISPAQPGKGDEMQFGIKPCQDEVVCVSDPLGNQRRVFYAHRRGIGYVVSTLEQGRCRCSCGGTSVLFTPQGEQLALWHEHDHGELRHMSEPATPHEREAAAASLGRFGIAANYAALDATYKAALKVVAP